MFFQIGSGFDVCAATYGSIDYCRVSSELLAAHMSACEAALDASEINDSFNGAVALISGPVDVAQWDYSTVCASQLVACFANCAHVVSCAARCAGCIFFTIWLLVDDGGCTWWL